MKLAMLMILASDLQEAHSFYCGLLGFRMIRQSASELVLALEGADLVVFKCDGDAVPDLYGSTARSVFVFSVESLDAEVVRLRANGVSMIHSRPAVNSFGRYAAFRDPFGNILEFLEPAPSSCNTLN